MKILLFVIAAMSLSANAQFAEKDSIGTAAQDLRFNYKQLIVPSVLIGYGVVGIKNEKLQWLNHTIRDEITEDIDEKVTVDDFLQAAPAASVYVLNWAGIKGKNNFRDRTVIIATSYAMLSATVLTLKSTTNIERPDKTTHDSFPSGHTANAFAGAEFMWQEYKDQSVWYGIAGYAVATSTGLFRIYNNRHWLTDVAAGAGLGILSTKAAYWLHPFISRQLSGNKRKHVTLVTPFYNGNSTGLCLVRNF